MASPIGLHKFVVKPGNWCYGQRYLELLVCFETGKFPYLDVWVEPELGNDWSQQQLATKL